MSKIDLNINEIRKQASIISGQHSLIRIAKDLLDSSRRNLTFEIRNKVNCGGSLYRLSCKLQEIKKGNERICQYIASADESYSRENRSSYMKKQVVNNQMSYKDILVSPMITENSAIEGASEEFSAIPGINEYLKSKKNYDFGTNDLYEKDMLLDKIELLFDYTTAEDIMISGLFSGSSTLVNSDEEINEILRDFEYGANYSDHLYSLRQMFDLDYENIDIEMKEEVSWFIDLVRNSDKEIDILVNTDVQVKSFMERYPEIGKTATALSYIKDAGEIGTESLAILLLTPNLVYNELINLKSTLEASDNMDEGLINAIDHIINEFDDKKMAITRVFLDYAREEVIGEISGKVVEGLVDRTGAIMFDLIVDQLGETLLNKQDELTGNLESLIATNSELLGVIKLKIVNIHEGDFDKNLQELNILVEASKKNKIAETEMILEFLQDNQESFKYKDDQLAEILKAGQERIDALNEINIMELY